jgi:hypothetical protein
MVLKDFLYLCALFNNKSETMKRCFNVAGPCFPQYHYMIEGGRRLSGEIFSLIEGNRYFVIYAARQSGKTTLLHSGMLNLVATK